MRQYGHASIVTTWCPILLTVQHLDRGMLPLLRHASCPPHSDNDFVALSQGIRVSICHDLQEFCREAIRSNRFAVRHRTDNCIYLVP